MQWANAEGLITGTTATTLSPQRTVSRAQLATILQRFAPMVSYQQRETDAPKPPQTHSYTAFTTKLGDVTRSETEQDLTEVHRATRRYTDGQGCAVEMGHSAAVLDAPAHTAAPFEMKGTSGTVRWYDTAASSWKRRPLHCGHAAERHVLPAGGRRGQHSRHADDLCRARQRHDRVFSGQKRLAGRSSGQLPASGSPCRSRLLRRAPTATICC